MGKVGVMLKDIILQREIYFDNRKVAIAEFHAALKNHTSKFSRLAVVRYIINQEEFVKHITKNKHPVAKPKEEQNILETLVMEAKKILGKEYDVLYKEIMKEK
jgi:hypothetical protein